MGVFIIDKWNIIDINCRARFPNELIIKTGYIQFSILGKQQGDTVCMPVVTDFHINSKSKFLVCLFKGG